MEQPRSSLTVNIAWLTRTHNILDNMARDIAIHYSARKARKTATTTTDERGRVAAEEAAELARKTS